MSKKNLKAELLKMLRDEMMEESKEESMNGLYEHMMPEKKMKATIMADSKEGLVEGAKKLPEILSKADEFKKLRLGKKEDKK